MTRLTFRATIIGLCVILSVVATSVNGNADNEENGILDCLYEANGLACAKKRADAQLDSIEVEVTGQQSSVAFSKVLEEAGALIVDGTRSLFGQSDESIDPLDGDDNEDEDQSGLRQARKKFGKKKKKHLQKLFAIAMLFKSKISLILQLISTHFQLKFFAIALLSLLLNAARFWIDIKKAHHPAKVIYYEHAQHQHHYDHDHQEEGGYWGRSSDEAPAQELAYSGYHPER